MRILRLSIILLFALAACQSENQPIEYDNSEAVYLKLEKSYVLHPDGRTELTVEKEQKLLTHRSFHSAYGQTDIYYNPNTDSVVVEVAETKTPTGEIVPVPENGYVDMIPSFATGSAGTSHLRHKAVVHTALEIGATVHSKYTVFSSPESKKPLMGHEVLNNNCPIENYTLTVKIPGDQDLDYNTVNIPNEPTVRKKGGYKIYTWKLTNIEQTSEEAFTQRFNKSKQQILFSSADDLFSVFNEFTSQKAFTFETSIDLRTAIDERLSEKYDSYDKLGTLQEIVLNEIQLVPVPLKNAGYSIRPAISTWETMSGTSEEKAILLSAMIRHMGFNAIPVAVIPEYLFQKDTIINQVGNLELLAFHLVQVPIDDQLLYLDVTAKHLIDPVSKLPDHYIIPMEMGYSQVHLNPSPDFEFQLSWDGSIYLDPSGFFTGSFEGNYIGQLNPYLGLMLDEEMASSLFPGKRIVEVSSVRSTLITFITDLSDQVTIAGDKVLIDLPLSKSGFDSWGIEYLEAPRKTTFYLPSPIREFQRLIISMPSGYQAMDFLTDVTIQNEIGRVSIRYTNKQGNLEAVRNLNISATEITPDQFGLFKELIEPWLDPSLKRLAIESALKP